MTIRKTTADDLDAVMRLYAQARQFMRDNGNPHQWGDEHPARELLERDLAEGSGYVCMDGGGIAAAFHFSVADDPTYQTIDGGRWLNALPYGVVHRLARRGDATGAGALCLEWCFNQCRNIRIDTHDDNAVMQKTLARLGYRYCGVIHLPDGAERIAYQKHIQRAAFPGSFDPPTLGHLDLIERARRIFEELVVLVAENPAKNNLFSAEERCALVRGLVSKMNNVSVDVCPASSLLVDFLRKERIDFIVRGVRDYKDWHEEGELAAVNNLLSAGKTNRAGVETVFLPTRPELSVVSSSAARTIARLGGDASFFIPPQILPLVNQRCLKERL
ncbi:MAG: pantetheine-phosphate adenylyltransferase [Spirochaetaceae bacterium]|jgi:pantetheine-phosphate adenylyltransferase|nr:pantetheine-phosphate adenylyltransferase [Spirochaetaceae bacterium]